MQVPVAPTRDDDVLNDVEKARIRAEFRYTKLLLEQQQSTRSRLDKLLAYLSNGFVLLLFGTVTTSVLVPIFQRSYEARQQRVLLMRECLSQFLAYSNSLWQEYYLIVPLTQESEIDRGTYTSTLKDLSRIKLDRYNSYAKVEALAIAFDSDKNMEGAQIRAALRRYAVKVNAVSSAVDSWLTGMYCTPTQRAKSPCARFDVTFDGMSSFKRVQDLTVQVGNKDSDDVAALIVERIGAQ